MNGPGKSDRPIGTGEASEQERVESRLAEEVEGRGLTKGKTFHHNKHRTQGRRRDRYEQPGKTSGKEESQGSTDRAEWLAQRGGTDTAGILPG